MSDEARLTAETCHKEIRCPLVDSGAFKPPEVSYCPACGSEVEETDTPTMYRCTKSDEVFYVEV